MKRCYYVCVRLCGVYVRGVLFPKIISQYVKNSTENQLVDKLSSPSWCVLNNLNLNNS